MTMRSLWVSLITASVLLLASCNGGGGDRLSRDEFIEQANKICSDGNARVETAGEDIIGDLSEGEQPSEEQVEEFFDLLTSEIQSQLDDIGDLSPPEDLEDDVDNLLEVAQSALDDLEEQGPDALTSGEDPFTESNELADDLGLTECAE